MRRFAIPAALVAGALLAGASQAGAADKGGEHWVRDIRLLVLPEEDATYAQLADPADRAEFERIFWARRDPDPATPANELQAAVARARTRADALFTRSGVKGADTDCGQLLLLLGEPPEVVGRESQVHFDNVQTMRGARRPEIWIYRSRPGDAVAFTGGELRVSLDEECRFAEGARVREDLLRVARARVVQPRLGYAKTADGHLARLEDMRAALSAPAAAPAATTRADFPLTVEPKLLLRTASGEAYAAGLVRAELGLGARNGAPVPPVAATVVVQAEDDTGRLVGRYERAARGAVGPDGSFVASYGVPLKPGRYVLRVTVTAGAQASLVTTRVEVPDFDAPGLKLGSLLVYPENGDPSADVQDPYSAFAVGALRLRPRLGNVFTAADALHAVCVLYGGQADPATGKVSVRARLSFSKDGQPVAMGQPETFDTAAAVVSVGPVPLGGYAPGRYLAKVEAMDLVSGKTQAVETAFEIAP
ncbi:MAG TPA: GWxTD domain-containing protein [Vicinamibacteria bacterium]|nr:GWxTD domain-containing protein [Vicinamibacteria bacterium]